MSRGYCTPPGACVATSSGGHILSSRFVNGVTRETHPLWQGDQLPSVQRRIGEPVEIKLIGQKCVMPLPGSERILVKVRHLKEM